MQEMPAERADGRGFDIDMVDWLTVVVLASGIGLFVPPTCLAVLVACSVGIACMEQMIRPLVLFLLLLMGASPSHSSSRS